jgi:hypothetical protein
MRCKTTHPPDRWAEAGRGGFGRAAIPFCAAIGEIHLRVCNEPRHKTVGAAQYLQTAWPMQIRPDWTKKHADVA